MVYTQTDARYLPQGYTPDNFDILCGRGKPAAKHPGNIIFMRLIQSSVKAYDNAGSRVEKTVVVTSIVSNLDDASMRFLKFDPETNRYLELSPDSAHAKVGHAIRDLLKQRKTKLNKSKKEEDRGSKNNSNSNSSSATQSIGNEKTPASPKPGASGSILPPVTNATSPSSSSRISAMFAAASFAASNNNKNKRKHPFAYFSPYDYARMLPQQQQQAYRHQQQQEYCLRQQQLQQHQHQQQQQQKQQQQKQQQQQQRQQQLQEQEQERAILQNIMQLPPAPPPTDSCYMPLGYVPNSYDILCGRGIPNAKHPGNIIFLQLIQSSVKEYDTAESRIEKTVVVSAVVTHLNDTGMRFLKYDPTLKRYLKLSSDSAHAKVGHAIRDLLKQEERKMKKNEESSSKYSNPAPTRTTTGGDQQSSTPAASSPTTAVPDTARSNASDEKPQQQQEEPQLRKPQQQQQLPLQHLPALTRPPRPPPQVLPEGYVPNNYDILCGRGKPSAKHPGNIVFMRLIQASVKQYVIAGSRVERTIVVSSIVSNIDASRMRFLKLNSETKRFAELDADSAHAKVGHAIRDLLKQEERKRNKSLKGEELSKRVTVGIGGKYKKRNKDNKDNNSSSSPATTPGVGKSSSSSSSPPSKSPIARPGTISSTSSSSSSVPATNVPDMAGSSNSNNSVSTTTTTTTTTTAANAGIPQQQEEVVIPQKTVQDDDDDDIVSERDSDVEVDGIAGHRSPQPTDSGGGGNGLFLQLVWAALKSEKMICDSSSSGAEEG